jgi:mRNA interferase RelE/StbE
MIVKYEKSFLKDIKKLDDKVIAKKLKMILEELESAKDLSSMPQIKKLKGHSKFFRLKIGNYRLGFSYEDNSIDIIRFLHRKDIYKLFP